jgi:hypothetical protein
MVCRAENKAREEQRERAAQKKQRTVIKKKKTKTSSKTKALMKAPKLDSEGKELTVDKGEAGEDDDEAEIERLFPGKKKRIGEDGQEIDDDDGEKKPAKKKVKKIIKIKNSNNYSYSIPMHPNRKTKEKSGAKKSPDQWGLRVSIPSSMQATILPTEQDVYVTARRQDISLKKANAISFPFQYPKQ